MKNPFENALAAGALALLALLAQAPARAQLIQGVTEVTPTAKGVPVKLTNN